MQGAIDGTHVSIVKPLTLFVEDYYYHKTSGLNIVAQAVVGSKKKFIDLFVGLPSSVNNSRVLIWSSLYRHAQYQGLFHHNRNVSAFPPYLLGDKGYPLIS
jgi:hypothetical protein